MYMLIIKLPAFWTVLALAVMGQSLSVSLNVHTGDTTLLDCDINNDFPDKHTIRHIDWLKVEQHDPVCPVSRKVYISNWMFGDDKFTVIDQFRDRVEHINLTKLKIIHTEPKDCGTYECEVATRDSQSNVIKVKFRINVTGEINKSATTTTPAPAHTTLPVKRITSKTPPSQKSTDLRHSEVHVHNDIPVQTLILLAGFVVLLLILAMLVLQNGFLYLHSSITCKRLCERHKFLTQTYRYDEQFIDGNENLM